MFILVCGTSGSGKSFYAEERLKNFGGSKKFYIATAKIYDGDEEMLRRVKRHQAMRKDKGFITIEKYIDLGSIKIPGGSSVLIEALTTWLANEMFEGKKNFSAAEKIFNDLQILKAKCENIILVSDDIFSDGIIYDGPTEKYIRALAELTIKFAAEADEVIECVAGLNIELEVNTNERN